MRDLAQTNVQLCNELIAAGWNDDDLAAVRRAYELAMVIFCGQYRPNGKTQIAHHVGVASAVAAAGDEHTVTVAALMHSAYFLGEWGEGRFEVTPAKRARLRAVVGAEVEQLVFGYTELPWNLDSIRALTERAPSLTDQDRANVLMRLGNEIDEFADGGMCFTPRYQRDGLGDDEDIAAMVELAGRLGYAPVGLRLRHLVERGADTKVPDVLVTDQLHTVFTFPRSSWRRPHVLLQDSRAGHALAEKVPGARQLASYVRRKLA
jgi:hypothetical protein